MRLHRRADEVGSRCEIAWWMPDRDFASILNGNGALPLKPAEFSKLIADETNKWAKMVKSRVLDQSDAEGVAPTTRVAIPNPPMSHMGQTRTSADVFDTSASPPRPDMPGSPSDVAEVPIPDSCTATKNMRRIAMTARSLIGKRGVIYVCDDCGRTSNQVIADIS